jgi:hypothetical protein
MWFKELGHRTITPLPDPLASCGAQESFTHGAVFRDISSLPRRVGRSAKAPVTFSVAYGHRFNAHGQHVDDGVHGQSGGSAVFLAGGGASGSPDAV